MTCYMTSKATSQAGLVAFLVAGEAEATSDPPVASAHLDAGIPHLSCGLLPFFSAMKFFLIATVLLAATIRPAAAQTRLSGKVLDAATGQPVPYASISVLNTTAGTTSNAEGEFEIRGITLPAKLVISELGHERDTVAVATAAPLQLRLKPASVMLPEVALGTYTEELIKKAYRQLQRSSRNKTYSQAFYRQITRLEGQPTEVQEMIWHAKTTSGGMEGTAMAQGRFAAKKALLHFNNFSIFTKSIGIFNPVADSTQHTGIISLNVARNYTLKLLGVTLNGNQNLVQIGFVSKSNSSLFPTPNRGIITIDEATHQVLHFRVESQNLIHVTTNNPTFKFKTESSVFEMAFHPAAAGAILDYIKVAYQSTMSRLLKEDVNLQASSFTSFYAGQPSPTSGVTYEPGGKAESDLAAIKKTTYDATAWQNNSAVKRTPIEEEVIKSFEQKGAFGTMLQ